MSNGRNVNPFLLKKVSIHQQQTFVTLVKGRYENERIGNISKNAGV